MLCRVDAGQHMAEIDPEILPFEQRQQLGVDRRYAEQLGVMGVVDDLGLCPRAGLPQPVIGQEGLLQRRAGAFHFRRGAAEQPGAAGFHEFLQGGPGLRGGFRAGIDAGNALAADQPGLHAFHRRIVEDKARGDHEEIIGQRRAPVGDHAVARRVELRDAFRQPAHVPGQVIRRVQLDIGGVLDPRADQVEARLVEMPGARFDDGNLRLV